MLPPETPDIDFPGLLESSNMTQTQPQELAKALDYGQSLAETRIVTHEVVCFLETVYHTGSFLTSLPSQLIDHFKRPKNNDTPNFTQRVASFLEAIYGTVAFLKTLYLFTASDFLTFAIPTILFGLFGALSGPILTTNPSPSVVSALIRIPCALLLIWTNLLIFNISNQRTPSAVEEDALNKPHRPIPSGRISIDSARRVNLVLVPVVLALSWLSGVGTHTLILLAFQWMYNDLQGCDEGVLLRNSLIAGGYGMYSYIGLEILLGSEHSLNSKGYAWLAVVTLVMLATQHICDIKDAPGDALRGRRSAPIVLGDALCRWSVALPILFCSIACPAFFALGPLSYTFTIAFGAVVAGRTLFMRSLSADKLTWKLWALWTCSLFVLPLVARFGDAAVVDARILWEVLVNYACAGQDCAEKLNVLAAAGVAMAVKGSTGSGKGMRWVGGSAKRSIAEVVVPSIHVEVVA
jgi:4-hydroxybenzoate polyprenyltransferase